MLEKVIYNKLYKIYIRKSMYIRAISTMIVSIMLLTAISPAITSFSEAKTIGNGKITKDLEELRDRIKPSIENLKDKPSVITYYSDKPSMERSSIFSRYLYLYVRYDDDEKWIKIDRISYLMDKLKGKNGLTLDINGDALPDIWVDFSLTPKLVRKSRMAFAYDTSLIVKRLSSCKSSEANDFVIKLYFYLPKIFTEKLISLGYRSPIGSVIPDYCKINHVFIPYMLRKGERERHLTLQYASDDPKTRVIMLSGEGEESSGWTTVESGHISIGGAAEIQVDGTFEVNGERITLSGTFYLNTGNDTVDIWWNTTRGYFKINGSGYFEAKDLHFDADGKITFDVRSLSIDADGFLEIDQSNGSGDLLLEGVADLEGLSFKINLNKDKVEFSGTFDISANSILDNFRLSWGKTSLSADGSIGGDITLNITSLHLKYGNFTVNAGKVSLRASMSLEFIKNGEIVICSISSAGASFRALYLEYSGRGATIDHIDVNGTLAIALEMTITGGEYVTLSEGHIMIGGDSKINVSVTTDINGTQVNLVGIFTLDTEDDTIDIWWNATLGYIKINGTSRFSVSRFFLWIENLGTVIIDELNLDAGGSLIINQSGKEGSILVDGRFDLEGLKVLLDAKREHLVVKGSFDFSLDASGWIKISWDEANFSIDGDLDASAYAYLLVEDLYVKFGNFTVSADKIESGGCATFKFTKGTISLSVPELGLKILDLYASYNGKISMSLEELYLNGRGSLTLSSSTISLNAHLNLALKDLRLSASDYGSLGIGYLIADGSASLTIANYLEASAGGKITIESLSVSSSGFHLGACYLDAAGSVYLYFGSYTRITAGGGITIVGLSASSSGAHLSIGYLSAGGSFSLYMGSYISVSAGGYLIINSLSGGAEGASLNLGSLQAHGGASLHYGSYIELNANGGLSLYRLSAHYSGDKGGLDGSLSSLDARGSVHLYLGDNIDLQASASLSLVSLHVTGDIQLDIGSLYSQGKVTLHASDTFKLVAGGGSLSLSNLYVKLSLEEFSGEVSISSLSLSGEGALSIGNVIDARCSASMYLGASSVTYNEKTVTINSISIEGGGHLRIPEVTKSGANFDLSGRVRWDISSSILVSHGDVSCDLSGNIQILNEGLHLDITMKSNGGRATIYIQSGSLFTLDLENFVAPQSGSLTVEGIKSSNMIEIYLDNNLRATWSHFAISGSGLGATLEKFEGDIHVLLHSQGNTNHLTLYSKRGFSISGNVMGFIDGSIFLGQGVHLNLYVDLIYTGGAVPDYLEMQFQESGTATINAEFQTPARPTIGLYLSITSADIYFKFDKNHPSDTIFNPHDLEKNIRIYIGNLLIWPPSWLTSKVALYAKAPGDSKWEKYSVNAEPGDTLAFKAEILGLGNKQDIMNQIDKNSNKATSLSSITTTYIYNFVWGDGTAVYGIKSNSRTYETTHTYERNGTYIARVDVYTAQDNEFVDSDTITVNIGNSSSQSLNVTLSVDKRRCHIGDKIKFVAEIHESENSVNKLLSGDRYTYIFDFDDGVTHRDTTNSKIYEITHAYIDWGIYFPRVTVIDNVDAKSGSARTRVSVGRWPWDKLNVTLSANPLSPKIGEDIIFTVTFHEKSNNDAANQSTDQYGGQNGYVSSLADNGRYYIEIDFDDGKIEDSYTDSNTETFVYSYSAKGTYNVKAFVYDQDTGKSGDAILTIYVSGSTNNNIEIEPDHINLGKLSPGETVTGSFSVINRGSQQIHWEVAETPIKGTWRLNPLDGYLNGGKSTIVQYSFTAPDTQNTDLGGYIKIWNVENHSDYDIITIVGSTPYVTGPLPPVIVFSNKPYTASEENNYRVRIYIGNSYDPDGGAIVKMRWDSDNDGRWDTPLGLWVDFADYFECDFSYEISSNNNPNTGSYVKSLSSQQGQQMIKVKIVRVTVEIKDDEGQTTTGTTHVTIIYPQENRAPIATANGPYSVNEYNNPNLEVTFSAAGSYDPDGDPLEYRWQITGHGISVDSGWITSETFTHSFKNDMGHTTGLSSLKQSSYKESMSPMRKIMERIRSLIVRIFGKDVPISSILAAESGQVSSTTKIFNVKLSVRDSKGATSNATTTLSITYYQTINRAPVARISGPNSGKVGQSITFSASDSYDPDGDQIEFRWDFDGNGIWDTAWSPSKYGSYTYSSSGTYTVMVAVRDSHGATDTASKTINIYSNRNPVAVVNGPTSGIKGNTYTFYGSSSYDPDGQIVGHCWEINPSTCFLAGTKILMADGSVKNVENIKVGDKVKAYDEISGRIVDAKVTKTFHHSKGEMASYYIVINGVLKVTPEHLIYVNNAWKSTKDIKIGDKLYTFDGREIEVRTITRIYEKVETFNIEVEEYHNFYANGILVHNAKASSSGVWQSGKPTSKSYTFTNTGTYTIKLWVKDNDGATSYDTLSITITDGNS